MDLGYNLIHATKRIPQLMKSFNRWVFLSKHQAWIAIRVGTLILINSKWDFKNSKTFNGGFKFLSILLFSLNLTTAFAKLMLFSKTEIDTIQDTSEAINSPSWTTKIRPAPLCLGWLNFTCPKGQLGRTVMAYSLIEFNYTLTI